MRSLSAVVISLLGWTLLTSSMSCATVIETQEEALKKASFHYKLADGYYRQQKFAQATAELFTALEHDPKSADAHFLLGYVYIAKREYFEAIEYLRKAVLLRKNFYEAQNALGACYLALCRWDEAIAIYAELIRTPLYRTPEMAHNNLGWAYWKTDRRADAIRQFKKAVFFQPKFCVGLNNLGIVYLKEGRHEDAERTLKRALSADPQCAKRYSEPHLHLARLYERQGEAEKACAQLDACLDKAARPEDELGAGCELAPVGLRCERKARELACPGGGR